MEYDLVIIGWGAAGFSAAIRASEISNGEMSIALIGKGKLGGTCVNVGCVPSKFLIERSAKVYQEKTTADSLLEKQKFRDTMNDLRNMVNDARKLKYEDVINNYHNVHLFYGEASFKNDKVVTILSDDGSVEVKGINFLIATGSVPSIPNIDGLSGDGIFTSDEFWSIADLPGKLGIIGGGPVGLEIGQAMMRFGSDVTIFESSPEILPGYDMEVGKVMKKILEEEGVHIQTGVKIDSIQHKDRPCIVISGKIQCFDNILVATGRKPNTERLHLQAAGVRTDREGYIVTDDRMRTTTKGIYAAGDCTAGKLKLETLSAREGVIAVENIFGNNAKVELKAIPWAIFTKPNIAGVGVNESDAVSQKINYSKTIVDIGVAVRNSIEGNKYGFVKMIIRRDDDKIIGIQVVSPEAADFIIEGALAIKFGLTIDDLINTIHIFPSHSEIIKIAAQSFRRDVTKMSCCVE